MARPTRAALLLPLLVALTAATLARASSGDVPASPASLGWDLGVVVGAGEDEEFGFPTGAGDSVARRVLQGGGYISYGALRRDNVPCSVRGASYYNCRPGGQANPYSRGCSAITRCRG